MTRLREAARFWEPRRLAYNAVLVVVVVAWVALTWPHFSPVFTPLALLQLLGLAAIANAFYSAVYLVDIPLQGSSIRSTWNKRRWILWLAGTLLAFVLTNYWIADEIYPYVS